MSDVNKNAINVGLNGEGLARYHANISEKFANIHNNMLHNWYFLTPLNFTTDRRRGRLVYNTSTIPAQEEEERKQEEEEAKKKEEEKNKPTTTEPEEGSDTETEAQSDEVEGEEVTELVDPEEGSDEEEKPKDPRFDFEAINRWYIRNAIMSIDGSNRIPVRLKSIGSGCYMKQFTNMYNFDYTHYMTFSSLLGNESNAEAKLVVEISHHVKDETYPCKIVERNEDGEEVEVGTEMVHPSTTERVETEYTTDKFLSLTVDLSQYFEVFDITVYLYIKDEDTFVDLVAMKLENNDKQTLVTESNGRYFIKDPVPDMSIEACRF